MFSPDVLQIAVAIFMRDVASRRLVTATAKA